MPIRMFFLLALASLGACSSTELNENADKPLSLSTAPAPSLSNGPKKLLVVQPVNLSSHGAQILEKSTLLFIESWIQLNGTFAYVPTDDLDTEEKFIGQDKVYDVDKLMDVAADHGISALVVPEIEEIEVRNEGDTEGFFRNRTQITSARVRIRVYDVKTRKQILSRRRTAKYTEGQTTFLGGKDEAQYVESHGEEAVKLAMGEVLELLPKYAKRIDWTGQIARIDHSRIYLDSGRITGLKIGQILKVYAPLHRVPNEATHEELGIARGPLRGTIKITDFVGEDGALAQIHSGNGFTARDHVEMFLPRHLN
ncbi:MAG: hypothetical protein KDD51_07365 [Bdellovibrionales bacterium]|nr:hypothetical protein [Bdellovibrionales bacterium]